MFSVILKHFLLYIVFLHRKKTKQKKKKWSQLIEHIAQWDNFTYFSLNNHEIITQQKWISFLKFGIFMQDFFLDTQIK